MKPVVQKGVTLMEASAGTGKTFRIAQLVLELVANEGSDIDRILVVTFTEAATSELRERVRRRLRDALDALSTLESGRSWEPPDADLGGWVDRVGDAHDTMERLRRALVDFDRASISTIHGFCASALTRYAFESGAGFGVELVGDGHAILEELATDFWLRLRYDADRALLPALEACALTPGLLTDLARKARDPSLPVLPEAPPRSAPRNSAQSPSAAPTAPDLSAWRPAFDAAKAAWETRSREALRLISAETVHQHAGKSPTGCSMPPGRTREMAEKVSAFFRFPPVLTEPCPQELHYFTAERIERASLSPESRPTHAVFDALGRYVAVHRRIRPQLQSWAIGLKQAFVAEVRRELPKRLARDNARTYRQLLVLLRDALQRSPLLCERLSADYDVALVDEFQDTDGVQWGIFEMLFAGRLQIIGDPKQAIYRFRGADVRAYYAAKEAANRTPRLRTNYRSDGRLVAAINLLFGGPHLREPFGGQPAFEQVAAHHPPSRLVGDERPALELRYLPKSGARTHDIREHRAQRRVVIDWRFLEERLPALVAADIATELARGGQIGGPGGPRAITPGDCAVLVRKNDQARAVQRALRRAGIAAVLRANESVLRTTDAVELGRVMAAAMAPEDKSAVRTALATGLMGFTAGELGELEQDDAAWFRVLRGFRTLHLRWIERGFMAMYQAWMDIWAIRTRLLAQGEERRVTNLAHLAELLVEAAMTWQLGPGRLLDWLRRGVEDEERSALRLESDADAVRVVTIHGAKGLEYPLVWCPFLWSQSFVSREERVHLETHDEHGQPFLDIGFEDRDAKIAERLRESWEEDLRLTYVALTRARHRCVVYWGVSAHEWNALGYLLHQPQDGRGEPRAVWRRLKQGDEVLRADLERLTESGLVSVSPIVWSGSAQAPRVPAQGGRAGALEARAWTRTTPLDLAWRRGSFSALVKGSGHGISSLREPPDAVDHDEEAPAPLASSEDAETVRLAEFPGGRGVGNLVHHVLELHDFAEPAELGPLVSAQLEAAGFEADLAGPLEAGLAAAIAAPWTDEEGAISLAGLPRAARLDELTFWFPVRGGFRPKGGLFEVEALARAFEGPVGPGCPGDYARDLRRLEFAPLRGFMTGAIDLVFEREGRWYVVDYKSNNLGASYADYQPGALREAMRASHYVLQYHLYTVALHRYLARRVRGYAYDTHVGGAYYLFLRGMDPSHSGCGVFFDRPPLALIEQLDEALHG